MARIIVFNSISLDGYFSDANSDMSFAHNPIPDAEWDAYVSGNASGEGTLLFGRITYQIMESFWPTPAAADSMPVVAEGMNKLQKVVFSRTLDKVSWVNTRLVKTDLVGEIQRLKKGLRDMVILGSGSLVSQLTQHGLIDEYQFIVIPVVLGKGRTMFEGIQGNVPMKLTRSRSFKNGNVLLYYEPVS